MKIAKDPVRLIWIGALWTLAMAALGIVASHITLKSRIAALEEELQARPPIAFIPVDEIVVARINEQPGLPFEEGIKDVRDVGRRLTEAGYMVLDARYVYGYPQDIEARPPENTK